MDIIESRIGPNLQTLRHNYKKFNGDFIFKHPDHAKEDGDLIELRNGIKCKKTPYFAAISQKKRNVFINLLSTGIYGQDNLADRCRRQQAASDDKLTLDDKITTVINEELYNYLRSKRFTLPQIEDELSKLPHYHHCAITSASSSQKYRNKNKKPPGDEGSEFDKENVENNQND